jgi:hypothetical protein
MPSPPAHDPDPAAFAPPADIEVEYFGSVRPSDPPDGLDFLSLPLIAT